MDSQQRQRKGRPKKFTNDIDRINSRRQSSNKYRKRLSKGKIAEYNRRYYKKKHKSNHDSKKTRYKTRKRSKRVSIQRDKLIHFLEKIIKKVKEIK